MPVVNYLNDQITFPDHMNGDEISDVLGALWASTQAVGEFAATLGTGAAAEVVGGWTALATGDANAVEGMRQRLTYQPRTRAGQIAMQSIGQDMQKLSDAAGLQHVSGYWRDRVVPALQEQAGPVAGSVLAAVGLAAMTALGEVNPGGRAVRTAKRQVGAIGDLNNPLDEGNNIIKGFHGSSVDDINEFDLDYYGSGEGGGAFGYGIHSSNNQAVGGEYSWPDNKISVNGEMVYANQPMHRAANSIIKDGYDSALEDAVKYLNENPESAYVRNYVDQVKSLENSNLVPSSSNGKVYDVEILANDDDLILWDEPIHKQSKAVRDAFYASIDEMGPDSTGGDLYQHMSEGTFGGDDKATSKLLSDWDIKGTKYKNTILHGVEGKDAQSGNMVDAEEAYNYSIFEPENIKIKPQLDVPENELIVRLDGGINQSINKLGGIDDLDVMDKQSIVNNYAQSNPKAMNKIFKKVGKNNLERQYAIVKQKIDSSSQHLADSRIDKIPAFYDPDGSEGALFGSGFEKIDDNVSYRDNLSSLSSYYKNPKTGQTARISDHAPIHSRSANNDILIHPGSHVSAEDINQSINKPKIQAYHGSPHDFDEFKMSQIGTGEGAQAYGHGLYFAESEDVAKGYREELSGDMLRSFGDKKYKKSGTGWKDSVTNNWADPDVELSFDMLKEFDGDYDAAKNYLKGVADKGDDFDLNGIDYSPEQTKAAHQSLETFGNPEEVQAGSMYQVEIDANPDDFLDWDKPLSEQSDLVKGKVLDVGVNDFMTDKPMSILDMDSKGWRGEQFLDKTNESALLSKGIKGIKYKDGFSRGDTGGTSNYVVFDDRLISISKKYGISIPAAAAMLGVEGGYEEQTDNGTFQ
jgi:hypothetical protein